MNLESLENFSLKPYFVAEIWVLKFTHFTNSEIDYKSHFELWLCLNYTEISKWLFTLNMTGMLLNVGHFIQIHWIPKPGVAIKSHILFIV